MLVVRDIGLNAGLFVQELRVHLAGYPVHTKRGGDVRWRNRGRLGIHQRLDVARESAVCFRGGLCLFQLCLHVARQVFIRHLPTIGG